MADEWLKRFHQSTPHSIEKQMSPLSSNTACFTSGSKHCSKKSWGIPGRVQKRLTDAQKRLLNKIYNYKKKSGNKSPAAQAEKQLRKTLKTR